MIRAIDKWLIPYLRRKKPVFDEGPVHVMIAVCDHFEPLHDTDKAGALDRIQVWRDEFPKLVETFRDSDGKPPKHTFFYPVEQYDPDLLEPIAELCGKTGSEVEIHLHHHDDTPEGFETALEQGKQDLASHGLLSRAEDGQIVYGFIHGNWALNNSDPQGRGCGVDREIPILKRTGCYADLTMPSAPHPTQTRTVNSIYYARDRPGRKAHDTGRPAECGSVPEADELLLIQGPLAPNLQNRKWGLIPKLENADLTGSNPPTPGRLKLWIREAVSVKGRPNWVFVKLHTHGGIPQNYTTLLGEPMKAFHESLRNYRVGRHEISYHYVTAREMVNIAHAVEDEKAGGPGDYRNYIYGKPPIS